MSVQRSAPKVESSSIHAKSSIDVYPVGTLTVPSSYEVVSMRYDPPASHAYSVRSDQQGHLCRVPALRQGDIAVHDM
jgi:hypothetical protein